MWLEKSFTVFFGGRNSLGVLTHVRFKCLGLAYLFLYYVSFHVSKAPEPNSLSGKKVDIHICSHIPSEMTSINCPDEETAFQDAIYTSKHTWFTKNETSFALAGRAKEMQKHTCLLLCIFCTIDRVICLLRIRLQQTLSVTHLLPLMRLSGSSVQPLFMASLSKITLVPKNYFDGRADKKHDIKKTFFSLQKNVTFSRRSYIFSSNLRGSCSLIIIRPL